MTAATDRRGASAVSQGRAPRVAFFGHDCTESTVIKRARAFAACGVAVEGFTFRRQKFNRDYVPEWRDTNLGRTVDRNYALRLVRLVQALPILWRARRRLARADFFYARNLDMCALALFARRIAGNPAPLAYEVLDVQRVFTGKGLVPFLFRFAERLVLRRMDLLVVSSPAFLSRYFTPVQGFVRPSHLLENKIFDLDDRIRAGRPTPGHPRGPACPPDGPWVIAWLGNLRCPRSPELLCRIAKRLGARVRIHVHGYPTETGLERFLELIAGYDNIVYFGEYRSPDDLQRIYDRAHFAWAFDYLDQGSNSDWLLPNRLYEGCYFGAPALAAQGTATGTRVAELDAGWTFAEPVDEAVSDFLERLEPEAYVATRRHLVGLPSGLFVDEGDTAQLCRRLFAMRHGSRALAPRPLPAGG